MEVMTVATSVPLSTADTGPLGFTENVAICHDLFPDPESIIHLAGLTPAGL
jgi:hypothetical protein